MSVFTRGSYGRLAVVLNALSSINIEIIIIIKDCPGFLSQIQSSEYILIVASVQHHGSVHERLMK